MSQILRDLNKLAKKVGAPVVGQNISEQIRALNTFWEASSHGANIAERINETAHSKINEGGSPAVLIEKSITANNTYNAADDNADGYSKVTVNVPSSSPTLIEKSITANGVYNASSDSADGYSKVTVAVQPEFYATPASFSLITNIKDIDVVVPSGVTGIAQGAFKNCVGLKHISIPDGASIGISAFEGCSSLENIRLPNDLTRLNQRVLCDCTSLKTLEIPATVSQQIDAFALSNLSSLEWLKFKRATAADAYSTAFRTFSSATKILVPLGSYGGYTTKANYPSPSTNLYLCYATYESGAALPTTSTDSYNLTWYASIADAAAETNPITAGNGEEVYARCVSQ